MHEKRIIIKLNKNLWLILIPVLFIMGSILRISGLLGYTGDYMTALRISLEKNIKGGFEGFYTVGRIFRLINIFGIETLNGWSIFLTIIFIPIIFYYCKELRALSITNIIFICGFIIFFSACACNISKEAIQVFVFMFVDAIAFSRIITNRYLKFALIFFVFLLNGLILRKYFYLVAIVFAFLSRIYILNSKKRKMCLFRDLVIFFFLGYLILTIGRICVPTLYYKIANTRSSLLKAYENANTLIRNSVNINNFEINWLVNYAITSFRIMFPVEFIFRGIKYIPFIIVQTIFSINLFKTYEKSNYETDSYRFAYFSLLAFIIVELVWEIDLGTMFRHEISVIALLISVILRSNDTEQKRLDKIKNFSKENEVWVYGL